MRTIPGMVIINRRMILRRARLCLPLRNTTARLLAFWPFGGAHS